jgi:hypothetical protein
VPSLLALLKWGVRDLAREAGLLQATVVSYEAGARA